MTDTQLPASLRLAPDQQRPTLQPLLKAVLHLDEGGYDAVALSTRTRGGWSSLTYAQLRRRSAGLAAELRERGVGAGERVGILAEPGDGWVTAFFAILRAGAVAVPLDRSLTTEELRPILIDAGAVACIASATYANTLGHLQPLVATLRLALELNDGASPRLPEGDHPIEGDHLDNDDQAAIVIYTSGTTGRPKGVTLTYRNLLHQVEGVLDSQRLGSDSVFLSLLPLSHMLELTCGLLAPLASGARICYSPSLHPHEVADIIRDQRVTRMVVVPLFLRVLKKSIEAQVRSQPPLARALFSGAHKAAAVVGVRALRRALFRPVHQRFGGALTTFGCGGAPLDHDVARFFERMGFAIMQGYGLTETSPIVTLNAPGAQRAGSVGRPLPGVRVAIGDGIRGEPGEVLVQGPCVMKGYLGDDERTRQAIDSEGWLHTGDLGHLDRDGYLYITGRAKNLIVLESGKKVQPEEVEHPIDMSPLVADVCVIERRTSAHLGGSVEVCAVVVPSQEARDLHPEPSAVRRALSAEVAERVRGLAPYKRPASVIVRDSELPKTSTRKVLRDQVATWLRTEEAEHQ